VPLKGALPPGTRFYEVLVRIQDVDLVLPAAFLPAAERYHLMPNIDRWVVENVFSMLERYYTRLRKEGRIDRATRFAINLSGQSLSDEKFLGFVTEKLTECGIFPGNICFEITETAAIANLARAHEFITHLKKLGCRFALDDFGSGLSSFGYLKNLPVDYVKIAGDFIRDITEDPVDFAMVGAINQIGHVMGLLTIAESVENEATLAKLRAAGVDFAQGHEIGAPLPFHDALQFSENEWLSVRANTRAAV